MSSEYWNSFYSRWDAAPPSMFAQHVAEQLSNVERIVDIGTGNGRDALFFAQSVTQVVGIDRSTEAIARARAHADQLAMKNICFHSADVGLPGTLERLVSSHRGTLFYARFFLHAIDDSSEIELLSSLSMISFRGDRVFFEFRTPRDESTLKVHGLHFRRFVEPNDLEKRMREHGFITASCVESQGLAPYGDEDPWVARMVFERE